MDPLAEFESDNFDCPIFFFFFENWCREFCTRWNFTAKYFSYVAVDRKSCARSIIVSMSVLLANFSHIIENARSHEGGSAPTVGFSLAKFPPLELGRRAKSPLKATPAQLSTMSHRLRGTFVAANTISTLTRIVLPEEKHRIESRQRGFLYIGEYMRRNISSSFPDW